MGAYCVRENDAGIQWLVARSRSALSSTPFSTAVAVLDLGRNIPSSQSNQRHRDFVITIDVGRYRTGAALLLQDNGDNHRRGSGGGGGSTTPGLLLPCCRCCRRAAAAQWRTSQGRSRGSTSSRSNRSFTSRSNRNFRITGSHSSRSSRSSTSSSSGCVSNSSRKRGRRGAIMSGSRRGSAMSREKPSVAPVVVLRRWPRFLLRHQRQHRQRQCMRRDRTRSSTPVPASVPIRLPEPTQHLEAPRPRSALRAELEARESHAARPPSRRPRPCDTSSRRVLRSNAPRWAAMSWRSSG
eukprot:COSAG02_NODE_174_length_31243_cov_76.084543_1_plen_296_part_00